MKVNWTINKHVRLKTLNNGDVFHVLGSTYLYMKVVGAYEQNAATFDGILYILDDESLVVPVDGEFVVS